jgi:long-chain acyl-CoA synthetase
LGAIVLPIDPNIVRRSLDNIVARTQPKAVFLSPGLVSEVSGSIAGSELLRDDASTASELDIAWPEPEAGADLLFTTGTTGRAKGVLLSHANILAAASQINAFIENSAEDREVVTLPLSHSFGLGRLRCQLLEGGTVILSDGLIFPKRFFALIEKYRATGLSFVPAGFAYLLKVSGDLLSRSSEHLRFVEIGSAPMPRDHKELLMGWFPDARICMHFGTTEASRALFSEFHQDRDALDSIGRPSPTVHAKVMQDEREVPEGDWGELWVKGPSVMQGYWQDPKQSDCVLRDGWFTTGDIVAKRADGRFYLQGRRKEIINVGGRKVAPAEVEERLNQLPGIEESACIGIPDPSGLTGEVVKAFLVWDEGADKPTPAELTKGLRKELEGYKIPTVFVWTERLPRTSSGKLQRLLLREDDEDT